MTDFFDTYKDIGGGSYISAAEKAALASGGVPFEITEVVYQDESKYGARFVLRVMLPDFDDAEGEPEARLLSFGAGTVESRDRMLRALTAHLEDPEATPPTVKLEKAGQAYLIRQA